MKQKTTRAERRRDSRAKEELSVFQNHEGTLIRGKSKWAELKNKSKAGIEYIKNVQKIEYFEITS